MRDLLAKDLMLYVGGSTTSYHCEECGSNVFRNPEPDRYVCNGCGAVYFQPRDPEPGHNID